MTTPCGGNASSRLRSSFFAYDDQSSAGNVSIGVWDVAIPRTRLAMIAPLARRRTGVDAGLGQAHRAPIRGADFLGLTHQERKLAAERQPRRPLARRLALDLRRAVDEEVAADDRQPHDAILLRIADHRLRLLAAHHALGILEDAPAHHDDAAVALAQLLL